MTVLQACQNSVARLLGRRPASIYSSQNDTSVEMAALANEAAVDIIKGHEWQQLINVYEIIADGTTTQFPLPADYDRMQLNSYIHDPSNFAFGYARLYNMDQWIQQTTTGFTVTPGAWAIFGNRMNFVPAPAFGQKAMFPYISKNYAIGENGQPKSSFDSDTDSFIIDDRLLSLSLIWRWKSLKGMDYQEDMRNYEIAFSQMVASDKGSATIKDGGGLRGNFTAAWPWGL